ncbi:MAG: InlB B-repeat-containing protein [Candidatus Bathyarchaeota archaeon]|nr:InlB B-repeat-containing protein [Candidatus Termiticorpusculum sp.]
MSTIEFVTYDADGGSGAPMDNNAYHSGDTVNILAGVPTKAGYTFAGWQHNGQIYFAGTG